MSVDDYIPEGHQVYAKPIEELYAEAMKELATPFPSVQFKHFAKLNALTGGLRPFEFSILCGSTGTGKTTLCANLSRDLTEQKIPHFVASVETGHTDFIKRMMSVFVTKDWNTGDAVPLDNLKQFHVNHGQHFQHGQTWLSLYDNRFSVEILMADIARLVKDRGVKVAIIDNLNFFLDVKSASESIVEMDRVIHELIIFCKRVDVHVIMVMHPKKTDNGRVDSEFDIKGSSTAVQEAHNVFLFNRPHPDLVRSGFAEERDRELLLAKMRRRGKYVRKRLILKSSNGVSYLEGDIV